MNQPSMTAPKLEDLAPGHEQFLADVLQGLSSRPRALPSKYFYDARGSLLFDEICALEEYYPTRTELSILEANAADIARSIGPGALVVEYGSGSSNKTRVLLDALEDPAGYVPVDIAKDHLEAAAAELQARYPCLQILPLCADFSEPLSLPRTRRVPARRLLYFPGSTIGNFSRREALAFLARGARAVGEGGGFLIGVDLAKDRGVLERAYDDARGVTAAFNLNLLVRINEGLGGDFDLSRFSHRATYDPEGDEGVARIEMQLISDVAQQVRIAGRTFRFEAGEAIRTEWSHKYTLEGFAQLAAEAGFEPERVWTDPAGLFSVHGLVRPR